MMTSLFLGFSPSAHAGIVLDVNTFYFTDALKTTTTDTYSTTAYAGFVGFNVDKKGLYQIGWNYASYASTNKMATSTVDFSSSQMGPGFIIYFDKDRTIRLGFAYNLETKASYKKTGSTEEDWDGTALSGDLGYQIRVSDGFAFGLRLNYSSTTIATKLVGTTQTDVSYGRNIIYPSISITMEAL